MKLEILISTYGPEGIKRLSRKESLPRMDGVGYLISWQRGWCDMDIPHTLIRNDVRVVITSSTGLGANRANAMLHARGEWCMIADDDLEFDVDGIRALMLELEKRQGLDFVIARSSGADNKVFPAEEYSVFPLRRRHFVTEFELLVRLDAVRSAGINYNPNFGVGSDKYTSGEGAVFMYEMRRKGLQGRYFPITIVRHPGLTTTERKSMDRGVLQAEGLVIALEYPLTGVLRVPLVVYRRWKRFGGSFTRGLSSLYQGFMVGIFRKKSLGIGKEQPAK